MFSLWALASVCILGMVVFASADTSSIGFWSRWTYHHTESYQVPCSNVCARLAQSMDDASAVVPGLRFKILAIDNDPFLVAQQGWGPWKEAVVLEAWATGDTSLDTIKGYGSGTLM